ncbi:hypothetical protein TELCIR_25533, partial [Teladorsagia circumcincta]
LLGLHWSTDHGDLKVYLYAPFWLVNNTSMTLKHMESEYAVKHLPEENPLILPFPGSDFSKKKK